MERSPSGEAGLTRRGASKLGCLLSTAFFVAAIYYGIGIGRIYLRYYDLVDEMRASARFALSKSDDVIRQNLQARIDQLGIPPEAKRLSIRRTGPPRAIVIRTQYRELLDLPLKPRYLVFKPKVESRF